MRTALQKNEGERKKFRAVFEKFGIKKNYHGYSEETILLKNIVDVANGKVITDHVWFTYSKSFQNTNLKEGVSIEFEARIKKYKKGYVNTRYKIDQRTTDYKLSHPSKISVVQG